MRYGIVINLDYDTFPHEVLKGLWGMIAAKMQDQGFRRDGRVFTIERSWEETRRLALEAIAGLDNSSEYFEMAIYRYIKEFYGFDVLQTRNLLVPEVSTDLVELEVSESERVLAEAL